jgi:hypothetical protein
MKSLVFAPAEIPGRFKVAGCVPPSELPDFQISN